MPIFVSIDGIKGNVTAKSYVGAIAVHSLQHYFNQEVSMPVGRPQDRMRSQPVFSEVLITKDMDDATNSLLSYAYSGKLIPELKCDIVATDDGLSAVARYVFKNVLISRYETQVGSKGGPMETLGLHFTQMETTYLGRDAKNAQTSPKVTGYNLETANVM